MTEKMRRADYNGSPAIFTEGGHVQRTDGPGKIAGVFAREKDARSERADDLALAIVAWESLTAEQRACALANNDLL